MSTIEYGTDMVLVNDMISIADSIVQSCIGPQCNVSFHVTNKIRRELDELGRKHADNTMLILNIPIDSKLARAIYRSYNNLSATVASIYSYHCKAVVKNPNKCVLENERVIKAVDNLIDLLKEPTTNAVSNLFIIIVLVVLITMSLFSFFIFLLLGLTASTPKMMKSSYESGAKVTQKPATPVPVENEIALPIDIV